MSLACTASRLNVVAPSNKALASGPATHRQHCQECKDGPCSTTSDALLERSHGMRLPDT